MITVSTREGVAVILVDNPPVNALAAGVPEAIAGAVAAGQQRSVGVGDRHRRRRPHVHRRRRHQAARAARRGATASAAPDFRPLFHQIEDGPKPVVIAIHGTCLGGGLELAMAGHYRVAVAGRAAGTAGGESRDHPGRRRHAASAPPGRGGDAHRDDRVGQANQGRRGACGRPDRSPDRWRPDHAAPWHSRARSWPAARRRRRLASARRRLGSRRGAAEQLAAGRELARQTRRHSTAALAAIDAIEAAVTMPFEAGSQRERAISAGSASRPSSARRSSTRFSRNAR